MKTLLRCWRHFCRYLKITSGNNLGSGDVEGRTPHRQNQEIHEMLQEVKNSYRLFEVVDQLVVLDDDDEPSDFSDTDPVVRAVKEALGVRAWHQ